jgi:hypothetical protein
MGLRRRASRRRLTVLKYSPTTFTLSAGSTLVVFAWAALLAAAAVRGREIAAFSILYNLPITLVFGSLGFDLVIRGVQAGPRRLLAAHGPVLLAWAGGAVVLFLRLVTNSIDVSGHMTWAILMATQCLVERAPRWFTALAWGVVVQVFLLKVFVLGGQSGAWGILAGGLLGFGVTYTRCRDAVG